MIKEVLKVTTIPVPEVVAEAEALLKLARAGRIRAFAAVMVLSGPGEVVTLTMVDTEGRYHQLNSGAARLAYILAGEPPERFLDSLTSVLEE